MSVVMRTQASKKKIYCRGGNGTGIFCCYSSHTSFCLTESESIRRSYYFDHHVFPPSLLHLCFQQNKNYFEVSLSHRVRKKTGGETSLPITSRALDED